MRTLVIGMRVSRREKATLSRAARNRGLTISDFLRKYAISLAERQVEADRKDDETRRKLRRSTEHGPGDN